MKKANGRQAPASGKHLRRRGVTRAAQGGRRGGKGGIAPPSSPPDVQALRCLADAAPLLLWTADASGSFEFLNGAWKELTGRSTGELRGGGWLALVHASQRDSVGELYRGCCEAGRPFRTDVRLLDGTGGYRLVRLEGIPRQVDGHVCGYVGTGREISPPADSRPGEEIESRFRGFAESLGQFFCAVDRDMRVTAWNRACEAASGLSVSEVLGRRLDEIFAGFDATNLPSYLEKAFVGLEASCFEYEMRRGETVLPVEVTVYPTRSGASIVGKDLTDRREAERSLRVSEAKYRTIFENANDAILILEPRTERILEANAKAVEMYGFSREELLGTSLKKLTMDIVRGEQQLAQTLTAGSSNNFETVHFRKDGTPMTLVSNAAVIEYRGAPAVLCINRDVSHILSVDEVLRGKDSILQRLLASSDDIVSMQDKEGRYLFYNGSPRFNLKTEDVRGRNPYDLFPLAVGRRMMERLYQVISTGKSVSAETQMELQGETFWFLDQLSPVRNGQGDVVSIVTISRNITERKRAEEKLRRSEERYRAFIDRSADGIWRVEFLRPIDTALPVEEQIDMLFEYGYLAECNQVMVRMLGHTVPDSLIGSPIGTIIPRDNPRTAEGLARFLGSGYHLEESETREIDAEGNVRYFTNGFTGILEDGCLVRIWGSRRDVTERKQVEREMRLLAQTITSTKDCVWITDLEERILFVNTASLATYGYAEEEMVGNPLAILRSPKMSAGASREILPATIQGGWYGEVLHRRKDGTEVPLELWTSVVKNDEGEPVALVGVARDISDRKRMEEALRLSEARLRRIADAMRDVVTQVDADGIVQYVSPSIEQVLGYRPDDTLGRSLFERVHPEEREAVAQTFLRAARGREGVTVNFRYQHAGGHYVWLEAVGNLLLDGGGGCGGGPRDPRRQRTQERR